MTAFDDDPVPSPCTSVCKMDPRRGTRDDQSAGGLCIGCLRTIDEIIEWGRASDARKRDILVAIEVRRAA
jgi:predicted Fe-S protein YdhL (DUF1289 family)